MSIIPLSNNYQSHEAVIAEANRIFEQAKTILATIPESDVTYSTLIDAFIPSQFKVGNRRNYYSSNVYPKHQIPIWRAIFW